MLTDRRRAESLARSGRGGVPVRLHGNLKTPSRTSGNGTEHIPFGRLKRGSQGKEGRGGAGQPQHLRAHAKANRIRLAMAAERRALRGPDGFARAAEQLADPPEGVARMRLSYLLSGLDRVGRHRTLRIARAAGLSSNQVEWRIGPFERLPRSTKERQLTERQRLAVADVLKIWRAGIGGDGVDSIGESLDPSAVASGAES